jgi:large subunit ribosomal protein L18
MNKYRHNQLNRKRRVRSSLTSSSHRPRLHVHRTNEHVYAQVIDDTKGKTIVSSSDKSLKLKNAKVEKAAKVGTDIATKAQKAGITKVAFDRGHYKYHGRVKALAEAARKAGLDF